MSRSSDAEDSLDVAKPKSLLSEIQRLEVEDGLKLIRQLPVFCAEEFQSLLSARCFSAAIEYEKLDGCCVEQTLLTDAGAFATIVELLADPAAAEYGLFFLGKIRNHSFSEKMFADAIGSLQKHILEETLAYCRNPILICVLVLEQLERAEMIVSQSDLPKFRKKALLWERVALSVDHKLVRVYTKEVVMLYLDTDIRGRTLPSLVKQLKSDTLVMMEGIGVYLDYAWRGPYRLDLHPMNYSTLYRVVSRKSDSRREGRRRIFVSSFKGFVMRPTLRFVLALTINIFCVLKMQSDSLEELIRIANYRDAVMERGEELPPLAPNYQIMLHCVYAVSLLLYCLQLFVHCCRQRIWFSPLNTQFLSSILASMGAVMFQYTVLSNENWALSDIDSVSNWTSVWLIGLWLNVIFQLELTEKFGLIVKTLKTMVVKTLSFSVLLAIIIYCYAAIFLMRNYHHYVQAESISNSFFYFFNAMLGNYDPVELYDSKDSWAFPLMISFVLLTAIILMNLLIAILSHIYENNQTKTMQEYRQIQMEYASYNIVGASTRLMNCAIPPFSIIAFLFFPLMYTSSAARVSKVVLRFLYCVFLLPFIVISYLGLSLLLIVPVYITKFLVILKERKAADKVTDVAGRIKESSWSVLWNLARWSLVGLPTLLQIVCLDTVQYIALQVEDVEPELLNKEVAFLSQKCESREPQTAEMSHLFQVASLRESVSESLDGLTSRLFTKVQSWQTVDKEVVTRVCTFTPQLATPWIDSEKMKRRLHRGLSFLDVQLLTRAIRRAGENKETKDVLMAVRAVKAILEKREVDTDLH